MAAHAGKKAAVYAETGTPVAMTDEATTCLNPGTYTQYQITATSKRYVDRDTVITVKKNGVAQPSSSYTFQALGGIVTFTSSLLGTDVVTVTGAYRSVVKVAQFYDWKFDGELELLDQTCFGDEWQTYAPGPMRASGSGERFWLDNYFVDMFTNAKTFIIVLYVDDVSGK